MLLYKRFKFSFFSEAIETTAISRLRPTDNVDELDEPVINVSSAPSEVAENKPKKTKIIKF